MGYKSEAIPLLPPFWPNLHLLLNLILHVEYNTITALNLLLAMFLSRCLHSTCIAILLTFCMHAMQSRWVGVWGGRFIYCQQKTCWWGEVTAQTVPFLSLQEAPENNKLVLQQLCFAATVNASMFACWLWRWELSFFGASFWSVAEQSL